MKVKWLRLLEIAKKVSGSEVVFVASAGDETAEKLRGAIKLQRPLIVYLNLGKNKTEDEIMHTLAHELAHAKVDEHSNKFFEVVNDLRKTIKEEYNHGA